MKLHEKIYTLRMEKKLSQGDLAELLDVSRQSVSKWETGASVPDLDKLIKMSDLFGVTLDALVREETPEFLQNEGENDETEPQKEEKEEKTDFVVIDEKPRIPYKRAIGKYIAYYGICLIFLIANYKSPWFGFNIFDIWWRIPIVFMAGGIPLLVWTLYVFRAFRFSPTLRQKIIFAGAWLFYLIFPIVMEMVIAFVWDGIVYVDYGGWLFHVWKVVNPLYLGILIVFTVAWIRTHFEKKNTT